MQIVSSGDNLQEMIEPIFWGGKTKREKKLWSAEFAPRVVKVNNIFCSVFLFKLYSCIQLKT